MSLNCPLFISMHSISHYTAKLSEILIIDRIRPNDEVHAAYVQNELVPSIAEQGLIQPIVLNELTEPIVGPNIYGEQVSSRLRLIAGYSRLSAFALLKLPDIPYVFRRDLDESALTIIEAEENVRRKEMPWQAKVRAIYKVHTDRERRAALEHKTWGQRATGALLNTNLASVNQAIMIAELLNSGDKELEAAVNLEAAKSIIAKRKQEEAERALAKFGIANISVSVPPLLEKVPQTSLLSLIPKPSDPSLIPAGQKEIKLVQSKQIPLSIQFFNTQSVTTDGSPSWMSTQPSESFDLIFTDIPFGIDVSNLIISDSAMDDIEDEHDVEENIAQFEPFLRESYRLLRPNSYCIFFFELIHFEKLLTLAKSVGFKPQHWPLLWLKTSQVQNRAAHVHWPKSCEYIMVLRKGTASLREPQRRNYYEASSDSERKKYGHPFAKPFDLCQQILKPILIPGMKVLDPYAGSGSMLDVVLSMGGIPYGVEKKTSHFNRLIENMKSSYSRILGTVKPEFV